MLLIKNVICYSKKTVYEVFDIFDNSCNKSVYSVVKLSSVITVIENPYYLIRLTETINKNRTINEIEYKDANN